MSKFPFPKLEIHAHRTNSSDRCAEAVSKTKTSRTFNIGGVQEVSDVDRNIVALVSSVEQDRIDPLIAFRSDTVREGQFGSALEVDATPKPNPWSDPD